MGSIDKYWLQKCYCNIVQKSCLGKLYSLMMGVVGFAAAWESGGTTTLNFQVDKEFPVFGKIVQIT